MAVCVITQPKCIFIKTSNDLGPPLYVEPFNMPHDPISTSLRNTLIHGLFVYGLYFRFECHGDPDVGRQFLSYFSSEYQIH